MYDEGPIGFTGGKLMKCSVIAQGAYDKLLEFKRARSIAAFLKCEGVTGFLRSSDDCPIATWMSSITGLPVTVYNHEINVGYGEYKFPMTNVIARFIELFDEETFPELIEEREE